MKTKTGKRSPNKTAQNFRFERWAIAWEVHHPLNNYYSAKPAVLPCPAMVAISAMADQADQAVAGLQGQALPVEQAGLKGRDPTPQVYSTYLPYIVQIILIKL